MGVAIYSTKSKWKIYYTCYIRIYFTSKINIYMIHFIL
jgi:hypothetical protein